MRNCPQGQRQCETRYFSLPGICLAGLFTCVLIMLSSCQGKEPGKTVQGRPEPALESPSATATLSAIPFATATPEPWLRFEVPSGGEITPVPPQANRVALSPDQKVWLIMGTEKEAPYTGRIMAMHILIVNERLAKASMISVPPNLFVYLPGVGMRRLSTSLALGGMDLVSKTLAYNFGLRPDRFILSHPTDFQNFVDYLGGLDVSVLFPIRDACGGIPSGIHSLNGQRLLCYVSYISGDDEVDRTRRQQEVLGLLLQKLVKDGRLLRLPNYYVTFEGKVETNFTMDDLQGKIPFMLRLGDSSRINYALLDWESLQPWVMDEKTKAQVLLPLQPATSRIFGAAQSFADLASPLSEVVLTYEAQATAAMAAEQTAQPPTAVVAYEYATSAPYDYPTATFVPVATSRPIDAYPIVPTLPLPTLPYP